MGAWERARPADPELGISRAQGNNRITGRSPGEDPILMVSQKPETLNQNNCNDHLQVKKTKRYTVGHTVTHYSLLSKIVLLC